MKILKCALNPAEIRKLHDRIAIYARLLPDKMEELAIRLVNEVGIPTIDDLMSAADGDSSDAHTTAFVISRTANGITGTVVVNGKDIAFIEFGAGMHYNGHVSDSPHPKGVELGYTIGSYGLGLGRFDHWYYNGIKSFGTEATMPLYNAAEEMREAVVRICKEVFA